MCHAQFHHKTVYLLLYLCCSFRLYSYQKLDAYAYCSVEHYNLDSQLFIKLTETVELACEGSATVQVSVIKLYYDDVRLQVLSNPI